MTATKLHTVKPTYNNTGLCDTSYTA